MVAQTAKQAELSHCSVSECCVLKDPLYLFDCHCIINVFIPAGFNHDRSSTVAHYKPS